MLTKKAVLLTSAFAVSINAFASLPIVPSFGGIDYLYSTTLDGLVYPGPGDGYFSGSNPDGQVGDSIQFTQEPEAFVGGTLNLDCLNGNGTCATPTLTGSPLPNLLNPPGSVSAGFFTFNNQEITITSSIGINGSVFTNPVGQLELLSDGSDLEVSPGVWQFDSSGVANTAAAQYTDFTTPGFVASTTGNVGILINSLTIDMVKWRLEEVSTNSYVFTGETANGSLVGVSFTTTGSTEVPFPAYSLWIMGVALLGLGAYARKRLYSITANS